VPIGRTIGAALAGLAFAIVALYGLVLQGNVIMSGQLGSQPLAAAPLARALLAADPSATDEKDAFVDRAIRQSPLSPEAFTYLGLNAQGDRADRLLRHAGVLSRHDSLTQQTLYNHFVDEEPAFALVQAEALMRRGRGMDVLFADFASRLESDPAFEKALADSIQRSAGEAWPANFLSAHATDLADADLVSLTPKLRDQEGRFDRRAASQVIETLRQNGRIPLSMQMYAAMIAPEGYPLRLTWDQESVGGSAFGWRVGQGYRVGTNSRGAPVLERSSSLKSDGVTRLLSLSPGTYRLRPVDDAVRSGSWRWRLSCNGETREITGTNWDEAISISSDCPVQRLHLSAPIGSKASLGALIFEKVEA